MQILFEDKHIIVCIKEAGILSEGEGSGCLPHMIEEYLESSGSHPKEVFPVHRLDRETVGVMVFAKTKEAAAKLSEDIRNGALIKEYLAICHGTPKETSATLTDLLYYDRKRGKSFTVDRHRAGVKEASLEYSVIDSSNDRTKLEIRLHTGRTHQIRVQFASRKNPLVGDRRYGAPKIDFPSNAIALAAHKLTFPHPVKRELMTFEAPTPEWFK